MTKKQTVVIHLCILKLFFTYICIVFTILPSSHYMLWVTWEMSLPKDTHVSVDVHETNHTCMYNVQYTMMSSTIAWNFTGSSISMYCTKYMYVAHSQHLNNTAAIIVWWPVCKYDYTCTCTTDSQYMKWRQTTCTCTCIFMYIPQFGHIDMYGKKVYPRVWQR